VKFRVYNSKIRYVANSQTESECYYWIKDIDTNRTLWVHAKPQYRPMDIKDGIKSFKSYNPDYKSLNLIAHPVFRGLL
jgi:hypothetical protein